MTVDETTVLRLIASADSTALIAASLVEKTSGINERVTRIEESTEKAITAVQCLERTVAYYKGALWVFAGVLTLSLTLLIAVAVKVL